jgi:hypothetical protein
MDKKCIDNYNIETDDIELDKINDLEDFKVDTELVEFNEEDAPSCDDLLTKDELKKIVDNVLSGDTEASKIKTEQSLENFQKVFESMTDKILPQLEKVFCDRNVVGEEFARYYIDALDSIAKNAAAFTQSLEVNETASQKLVNIVNAYRIYKESCALEYDIKLKSVRASKQFLNAELTKMMSEAKAIQLESHPQMLAAKYKLTSMQAEEAQFRAQAAAFEANEDVQKLKHAILQMQKEGEEANAISAKRKIDEINAQIRLILKQRDGFRLDTKIKLLNVLMDGWKTGFIGGDIEAVPSVVTDNTISKVFSDIFDTSFTMQKDEFKVPVSIKASNTPEDAEEHSFTFTWDAGVNADTSTLRVNYPYATSEENKVFAGSSGEHTITFKRPEADSEDAYAVISVFAYYKEQRGDEDDCCATDCAELYSVSSTITVKIEKMPAAEEDEEDND